MRTAQFRRHISPNCIGDESTSDLTYDMVISVQRVKTEMKSSTFTTERQPADEATLCCPKCDYVSRINGDWIIHVLTDSLTYECPNCETRINSRRNEGELTAGSGGLLRFTV